MAAVPSRSLNALVVSDLLIDLAADLLGTDEVRMYLALASAKYAGQPSGFNQLFHTDYPNHRSPSPAPSPGTTRSSCSSTSTTSGRRTAPPASSRVG